MCRQNGDLFPELRQLIGSGIPEAPVVFRVGPGPAQVEFQDRNPGAQVEALGTKRGRLGCRL